MHQLGRALLLTVAVGIVGCGSSESYEDYKNAEQTPDSHAHPAHGPNGGHVIDLGDHEYSAELVMDSESRDISLYLFNHDLDEALPIEAETVLLELEHGEDEVALEMNPTVQEGDEEGKASLFKVTGAEVPEELDDIEKLHGHFHVEIAGKEYVGEISHEHEDEDGDEHHDDDEDTDS